MIDSSQGPSVPPPILAVENGTATYGPVRAFTDISLSIAPGELAVILGANGAGKSSFLHSIAGVGPQFAGKVLYAGRDISSWSPEKRCSEGIALVPEGRRLYPALTVRENLRVGAITVRGRKAFMERLDFVQQIFPIVTERSGEPAGNLSGGQQQQVAIARALMSDPKVLLLDEPSLGLAPTMVERLFESIEQLRKAGKTMLLVEQNVTLGLGVADYAYLLTNGRITQSGTPSALGTAEQLAESYFGLGEV